MKVLVDASSGVVDGHVGVCEGAVEAGVVIQRQAIIINKSRVIEKLDGLSLKALVRHFLLQRPR